MGVVNFQNEVGDGQLKLMHPQSSRFRLRREPMTGAEIEQNVGGLPDHELSGFEERRREGRRTALRHHLHHRRRAASAARDIGIIGARLFQREADIFAAALNGRPVIEFVFHRLSAIHPWEHSK